MSARWRDQPGETVTTRHRTRSTGAVAAGFFVTALLSIGTDAVMHATGIFPPIGEPMSNGLFVWATVYRVVFTALGGYVTAALALRRPMFHVMVLGGIGTVAATLGAVATWNAGPAFGPRWYPILLIVTALPCVWAGGRMRVSRHHGATPDAGTPVEPTNVSADNSRDSPDRA